MPLFTRFQLLLLRGFALLPTPSGQLQILRKYGRRRFKKSQIVTRDSILRYLPVLKRKTWAANTHLLLDFDHSLLPFRADFFALLTQLTRLRGQAGLEVFAFPDGDPTGRCLQRTAEGGFCELGYYPRPSSNTPILILSDLGCNNLSDNRHMCWRRFGHRLGRSGARVMALMPCPPSSSKSRLLSKLSQCT